MKSVMCNNSIYSNPLLSGSPGSKERERELFRTGEDNKHPSRLQRKGVITKESEIIIKYNASTFIAGTRQY